MPTITLEASAEYGATIALKSETKLGGQAAQGAQKADTYTAHFK